MILYTNGCSHSRGSCGNEDFCSHPYITASSLFGKNNFEVKHYTIINAKPHTFSNYENSIKDLNDDKNYLIYQPHFGKGNDRIFFETLNYIYECELYGKKIDFAVIQWSGPNRNTVSLPDKADLNSCELFPVNPHDFSDLGLKYEPWASATTIQYMVTLQKVFELYNIDYVFIPYMEIDSDVFKKYSISKQLNIDKFTSHPIIGHRNDFRRMGLVCDTHGHPSELGSWNLTNMTLDVLNISDSIVGFYDYFDDDKIILKRNLESGFVNQKKWIKNNFKKLGDSTQDIINKLKNI